MPQRPDPDRTPATTGDGKGNKNANEPKKKTQGKGDKPKGQDTIDRDQIEEEYGLSYALFKAFPELDKLLKAAIAGNFTPQKFQVELRQTKWFEKHSDVWRENTALKFSDPATFEERLGTVNTKLQDLAASVGVSLSAPALERMAKRALLFGMADEELRDLLSNHVKPGAEGYTGDLAGIESSLRQTAYNNGVTLQDDQLNKWMQAIVRGDANEDQFRANIRNMAAASFPLYGEQVRGGMDLMDVATPYLQSMSEVLELAPGSVGLNDPLMRKALSGNRDPKGAAVPMNTAEFEDLLRQDKRWGYTKKANDGALGFASAIARAWGLT